ncbi:hypothetical protein AAKU55_000222 [Oxalobacteraceae bacterium GrIS 1.11]
MPELMYQSSVPVFIRYLGQLALLVRRAEEHAGSAPDALLQLRLAADMHCFLSQVQTADDFALRSCALLSGAEKLDHGAPETGFAGLRARLAASQAFLQALPPAWFDGSATRMLDSRAGDAMLTLDGHTFLLQYALPNFFFHVSMAYALLRQHGVELGKRDFDAFHSYPQG